MKRCGKLRLVMLAFRIRVPVQVRAPVLLICRPASAPEKAVDDGSSAWLPTTDMGDLTDVPGSWLPPDPALRVAAI